MSPRPQSWMELAGESISHIVEAVAAVTREPEPRASIEHLYDAQRTLNSAIEELERQKAP